MRQRLYYLDAMKGILIMLVVLGHAIQFTIRDYQHNLLFRFIYSFHMPLFFCISGFLTYRDAYDNKLIGKRAKQLLVPFVSWAFILPIFVSGALDLEFTMKVLLYPDNGLWFLYVLFVYSAIFNLSEGWCCNKIKQEYLFAIAFVGLYGLMAMLHTMLNVTQLCWYLPFFSIGYYLRKYDCSMSKRKELIILISIGGIYFLTFPFWMMREEPLFYRLIDFGGVFAYLYRYLVQIVGMLFFFMIGKQMLNFPINWLNKLGTTTLGIYAFQFIVLNYLGSVLIVNNNYLKIAIEALLSIVICYIIVLLIKKMKYIKLFLIGEK